MADDSTTAVRKKYAYDDKLSPVRKEFQPISEKRRRLWNALNEYIRGQGGWLVSHQGEKFLRVEVPRKSSLPSRLIEFGYDVKAGGVGTRIEAGVFVPVDLITFALPVK